MLTTLELAQRLRISIGRLGRRLRQQSLGDLTPSQASILSTLDKAGPMTMAKVADLEVISRPSATGIINRLHDKGLVDRSSNPADLRSHFVGITDQGKELLELRRQGKTTYLVEAIEELSHQERKTLDAAVSILEKLERRP